MYDTTTVISYVRKALPDFFGSDTELKAGELSDGNGVMPENEEFMRTRIYGDGELHARVGMLKAVFETKAQALLHGDLHSGSVFVTPDRTCILDEVVRPHDEQRVFPRCLHGRHLQGPGRFCRN